MKRGRGWPNFCKKIVRDIGSNSLALEVGFVALICRKEDESGEAAGSKKASTKP